MTAAAPAFATGKTALARCIELLTRDGATVRSAEVPRMRIDIAPPPASHPLWRDCGAYKITPTEVTYATVRFGCMVHWTLARTEAARYAEELRKLARFFEGLQ